MLSKTDEAKAKATALTAVFGESVVPTSYKGAYALEKCSVLNTSTSDFAAQSAVYFSALAYRLDGILAKVHDSEYVITKVGRTGADGLGGRMKPYRTEWDEEAGPVTEHALVLFHTTFTDDGAAASTVTSILEAWLHLLLPNVVTEGTNEQRPYVGGGVGEAPCTQQLLYVVVGKRGSSSQAKSLRSLSRITAAPAGTLEYASVVLPKQKASKPKDKGDEKAGGDAAKPDDKGSKDVAGAAERDKDAGSDEKSAGDDDAKKVGTEKGGKKVEVVVSSDSD